MSAVWFKKEVVFAESLSSKIGVAVTEDGIIKQEVAFVRKQDNGTWIDHAKFTIDEARELKNTLNEAIAASVK